MMTHPFLPDSVVHALGWTLAHSFWQGTLAALMLWLALPRLRSAQARYRAGYAALMLVFFAAIASFSMVYEPEKPDIAIPATPTFSDVADTPAPLFLAESPTETSRWQMACDWLENHHAALVTVWLLGFGFFLLRLGGGLFYVRQMRTRGVRPVPDAMKTSFENVLARTGIRRTVALLESALAHTPLVIGYLKPVILLPVGLLNQLSAAEVEAVLAHELAHIARRDWVLNLVQSFVEAVFYYHPAIWWMSAIVRAERENCCDDFAVSLTDNRLFYAKTLLRVQEFACTNSPAQPALALALDGPKTFGRRRPALLDRVKRILNQPQTKSPLMEKLTATGILLALIGLFAMRAQSAPIVFGTLQELAEKPVNWVAAIVADDAPADFPQPEEVAPDSIPKGKKGLRKISHDDGDRQVEMTLENDKITALKVDGKDIAPADFDKYEDLTDEILAESVAPPPPPMPPFPAIAPMAPMAPMPPMPPADAFVPVPPFPGGLSTRVYSDKDDEGNTVIRVERGGEPMEIVVKDGKVLINGEEVEAGQSIDLGGRAGNNSLFWHDGEGHAFQLDGNRMFLLPEGSGYTYHLNEEALRAAQEQMKAAERQMKDEQKHFKKEQKQLQKELDREMKAAQSEAQRAMCEQERAMRQAQVEMGRAHHYSEQARRASADAERSSNFMQRMKNELHREGILKDPDNFSIELSGKKLRVDGKTQPDSVRDKYLQMYEDHHGKTLDKKDKISIQQQGN